MSRFAVLDSRAFWWINRRTGAVLTPNARAIKCVDERDGRIVGMVAYDAWTPASVQAHIAVDTPIAWRAMAGPAFWFPFVQCGVSIIFGLIHSDNARSLALVKAMGFRELYRVKDAWTPGVDLVLHEMRRHECRFLKEPWIHA